MTGRRLVLVSAGLAPDGGGSAALGRLTASAAGDFCGRAGVAFEVLHLGAETKALGPWPTRHFGQDRRALVAAVARAQQGRSALLFDHLGPARVQALMPGSFRAPYALFLLGLEIDRPLSWDRRRALAGARQRLAISEHTRRLCQARMPHVPAIDVLYPALAAPDPQGPVDAALLARAGAGFFLVVGRLAAAEGYKGHDALLEALGRLRDEGRATARLVVAGEGDDRTRLAARAGALGLGDAVLFTGFVNEPTLLALYERCRAFAMPSSGEGFGLVYLEAMRAGRACIALEGSAAAEIVVHEETGLLVRLGDASLERALSRLDADAPLAARLGAAGLARFQERFSRERFGRELDVHLGRLLEAA